MAVFSTKVPPVALSVPELLNVVGLMVSVCPAVLAMMVPALLIVEAELWLRLPRP